jgi:hypothetical protein
MRRAVAFCQVIERQKGAKVHKVSSKQIAGMFQKVVDAVHFLIPRNSFIDGVASAS